MIWKRVMEQNGEITEQQGVVADPFFELVKNAKTVGTSARIKMMVGNTISIPQDYQGSQSLESWPRCECTVEIECPQDKASIDYASKLVFNTALQYMNEGMLQLIPGYPPIVK